MIHHHRIPKLSLGCEKPTGMCMEAVPLRTLSHTSATTLANMRKWFDTALPASLEDGERKSMVSSLTAGQIRPRRAFQLEVFMYKSNRKGRGKGLGIFLILCGIDRSRQWVISH